MAKRSSSKKKNSNNTPMMRQYLAIKKNHPESILMYRMGDFYEMFFEDALVASEALDLTLTSRNKNDPAPIPMCGLPHHAAAGYISKLIEKGFKVAVCEQMEDPTKVKGLVKREVVQIITPGVVLDEENLDAKINNYLAAVLPAFDDEQQSKQGSRFAVAVIDASTGSFRGTEVMGLASLVGELFRLEPRELLLPSSVGPSVCSIVDKLPGCFLSKLDPSDFELNLTGSLLNRVLGSEARNLADSAPLLARAAGAVLHYVANTRKQETIPPTRLVRYQISDHLIIDEAAKRHLELVVTNEGQKRGSLLWLLDQTKTPMGARLLRNRINYPLCDASQITHRLDQVELFFDDTTFREDIRSVLSQIGDLERLTTRLALKTCSPKDLGRLRDGLALLPDLVTLINSCRAKGAETLLGEIDPFESLTTFLTNTLADAPPLNPNDGGIFAVGFNEELDELTNLATSAKDFIANLEQRERSRTGINSLKVSYNKVFGYFILVTKSNLKSVPDDYIRKQTVVNGERFITKELQEWEAKVLQADEKRKSLERALFHSLIDKLLPHVPPLMSLCGQVAALDAAQSLAQAARQYNYKRPLLNNQGIIHIKEGRHPLVEAVYSDVPFVPNDILLDPEKERLMIITGPNMAGKSTVMRQVALSTVMAQMGSFVPAEEANLCITDRLFTRVGASDNIAQGASTFMVEMNETADIVKNATSDSLVILDEVGRGTSTFDGLSIAWSVGEYLHDVVRCKTMFATHYHELVELANLKSKAANYHVAAREFGEEVVFLRKLVAGGTSHSFGIQVAKMAGLPELVVQRAKEVLKGLEDEDRHHPTPNRVPQTVSQTPQLNLWNAAQPSEVERIIEEVDLNRLTPMDALTLLTRLQGMLKK